MRSMVSGTVVEYWLGVLVTDTRTLFSKFKRKGPCYTLSPQPWLHRLLPVSDSPGLHVGGIRLCLSFCVWLISRSTVSERPSRVVCASELPPFLRLNQILGVSVFCPWTPGLLPPPGYSEFCLNRVSSNSPRPAFSALGTEPEVELLGHAAALACGRGACLSPGAGSVEQVHRAPEPRRDVQHACLRCRGQGERFHPQHPHQSHRLLGNRPACS